MQTVSQKGQMVLPADFRQVFQVEPGTLVLIIPKVDQDEIVIKSMKTPDPVVAGYGLLAGGESLTKALLRERKEERKRDEEKYARILSS